VCVCVCVCVRERERERERAQKIERPNIKPRTLRMLGKCSTAELYPYLRTCFKFIFNLHVAKYSLYDIQFDGF
jgi:hypothetical protein